MAKTKVKTTDAKTLELIKLIARKKEEIAKAEKPAWKTNCSFSYTERPNDATNLHAESSIKNLVCMAGFLLEKERVYKEAAVTLGVEAPDLTWSGFPVAEWIDDIKLRITRAQIASKKKSLEGLESRLNAIISPELKAEMELEEIFAQLED